jgi:hypothetical protein
MTVNSQGITYKINGLGQRVSEAFSGNTTHYIHDIGGNVIAEADGSTGTTTMEYVWMGGELLAQIDGSGNIVYVHNSQVAASQKITNPSRTLYLIKSANRSARSIARRPAPRRRTGGFPASMPTRTIRSRITGRGITIPHALAMLSPIPLGLRAG